MSDNDNLNKQLEVIHKQLNQMRREILQNRITINETHQAINKTSIRMGEIRIDEIQDYMRQSRFTDFALFFSIFLSASIGVVGNWFVSLWFQPHSEATINSLKFSGGLLVGIFAGLVIIMVQIYRRIKRQP